MLITIKRFALTGQFGPIHIGMDKSDVIKALGNPDDEANLGETGSEIIYSWYEFFFNTEGKLRAIQIDNYDPGFPKSYEYKSEIFEIDPWFMRSKNRPKYSEIRGLLIKEGVEFDSIEYYERDVLVLESGVVIDFDDADVLDEKGFIGFRFFPEVVT